MYNRKMKVVNHHRLQQYEHHYGMVCLTGMLGCRWHRYQQSQEASTKCDIVWYILMLLTSMFTFFWFYYWLLAENSWNNLNWYVYDNTGTWLNFYGILFILTCTTLAYVGLLNILALCHVGHSHQVHIHWFHKLVLVLVLIMCAVMVIVISDVWSHGWLLQQEALMITGPFLHLSAVTFMTLISWFIVSHWISLYKLSAKVVYLVFFTVIMLFLYFIPIMIESPCINEMSLLPSRPNLVGHRGVAAIRPENTQYSFQAAEEFVITLESDVLVSFDGVPFMMHDSTLKRTTDVRKKYPEDADRHACWFNSSDLSTLDAGSWFLETDPFGTVKSLSAAEKQTCRNQSVTSLDWFLQQAKITGQNVMFDLKSMNECQGHPHQQDYEDVILTTIINSGINSKQVWYIVGEEPANPLAQNLTKVFGQNSVKRFLSTSDLQQLNIKIVNAEFGALPLNMIRLYQEAGILVNIYVVDSSWLYSLYWCMGVNSTTTNQGKYLANLIKPVWQLTPKQFRAMWITADVVSAAIIIVIFVMQHLRKTGALGKTIHSERLSLQGARIKMSHMARNRNMKEKLLHTVESLPELDAGMSGVPDSPDWRSPESSRAPGGSPFTERVPRIHTGHSSISRSGSSTPQRSTSRVSVAPERNTPARSSSRLSVDYIPRRSNSRVSVGAENSDIIHPSDSNRFSAVSGWSGLSGISVISGTDVIDSSFGSVGMGDTIYSVAPTRGSSHSVATTSDEFNHQVEFSDVSLEVPT